MAEKKVVELSESDFAKFIADKKAKLVVVDFFAEWCFPCTMMAPIIENVSEKLLSKGVKIGKLNVDAAQKTSNDYKISSIPCIVFFKNGKVVDRINHAVSEEQLEEKIKEFL